MARDGSNERPPVQLGVCTVSTTSSILSLFVFVSGIGFNSRLRAAAAGLLRVHAARKTGRILAADMCGPAATYLAQMLALAVERQIFRAGRTNRSARSSRHPLPVLCR